MPHARTLALLSLLSLCASASAQAADTPDGAAAPRTVPERSDYERTSTADDVAAFVEDCRQLPHGDRLSVAVAGSSGDGREMLLVKASLPADPDTERLRALVIGNIHAGEVEGKEALQVLLREFANGEHEPLLRRCDVWFVPIYNVDGNEAMRAGNRRGQNGPDVVGTRHNGQDLDLNRDFVKADAAETRVLLGLFRELDPHLFVDLHTTNGSHHGYQLTYAPSLSTNQDPAIAAFSRDLLERVRGAARSEHGFEMFDYGNFETRDWDGGGAPESGPGARGWYSYDHRARYGVNYFALRNRIAVLSEAYSYDDFETRIRATRAFVLELLRGIVADEAELRAAAELADARPTSGARMWLGSDTTFAPPEELPVLVSQVEKVERDDKPVRYRRTGDADEQTMPVFRRFRSRRAERLPEAWAIPAPTPEVLQRLRWHGITFAAVDTAQTVSAQRFRVDKKRKPKRPYQGHQALELEGEWLPAEDVRLALGTVIVPGDQRLARLAAVLLEPRSEDSLSTWNFFEHQTDSHYPVLRLAR